MQDSDFFIYYIYHIVYCFLFLSQYVRFHSSDVPNHSALDIENKEKFYKFWKEYLIMISKKVTQILCLK